MKLLKIIFSLPLLEEKQTPVPSISWAYKLVCGYIAVRLKAVASVPADLEILWFSLKFLCAHGYSQRTCSWETSAVSQMCDCHLDASRAFQGEVKWLQWATAEGNVAWQIFTFPWNEIEAFTRAALKYLLWGKNWWVVKKNFENFSAVSLWSGQFTFPPPPQWDMGRKQQKQKSENSRVKIKTRQIGGCGGKHSKVTVTTLQGKPMSSQSPNNGYLRRPPPIFLVCLGLK